MADGDKELLEVPEEAPYPLGRHQWHDPQNRDYPMRALLPKISTARDRPWWRRDVYRQRGPSCTAQAAAGVLATSPVRMEDPQRESLPLYDSEEERHQLYLEAQHHDPWPGTNYAGSSTDAPFKVLRNKGHIKEWRWCFGFQDVLDTLNAHGPVAIGTRWYASMFDVNEKGYVEITGGIVGGHAYDLLWNDSWDNQVRAVNSWGRKWGQGGRFWLTYDQLDRLLGEGGEAVTVVL